LAKELAPSIDANRLKGGVYSTTGQSIGFNYDEATSALDNRTEKYVIDALNNLDKDLTVILIAHRINTLRFCDVIFKINKGRLVGEESFNQLIKKLT
jgi:ABC-type transport system involved in cytochrome bd biosynthesis fused ATPase/permease subunit